MDTEDAKDTRNPVWAEHWKFLMTLTHEELKGVDMVIEVWDTNGEDGTSDTLIGSTTFRLMEIISGAVHNDRAITSKSGKSVTGRIIFDFSITQCRDWSLRPISATFRLNRRPPWLQTTTSKPKGLDTVRLMFRKSVGTDVKEEFITRMSEHGSCRMPHADPWILSIASYRSRLAQISSKSCSMSPPRQRFMRAINRVIARNRALASNRTFDGFWTSRDLPEIVFFGTYDEFVGGGLKIALQRSSIDSETKDVAVMSARFDTLGTCQVSISGILDDERTVSLPKKTSDASDRMKQRRLCTVTRNLYFQGKLVGSAELRLEVDEAVVRQLSCGVNTESGVRSTSVVVVGAQKSYFRSSDVMPREVVKIETLKNELRDCDLNRVLGRKSASAIMKEMTSLLQKSSKSSLLSFTYSSTADLRSTQSLMMNIWEWVLEHLRFAARLKPYIVMRMFVLLRVLMVRAELLNQELLGFNAVTENDESHCGKSKKWGLPPDVEKLSTPGLKKYLEPAIKVRTLLIKTARMAVKEIYRRMSTLEQPKDYGVELLSEVFSILAFRFPKLVMVDGIVGPSSSSSLSPVVRTPSSSSPLRAVRHRSSSFDRIVRRKSGSAANEEAHDFNFKDRTPVITARLHSRGDWSMMLLDWSGVETTLRRVFDASEIDVQLKKFEDEIKRWSRLFRRTDSSCSRSPSGGASDLDGVCFDSFVAQWIKYVLQTVGLFRRTGFGKHGNLPWSSVPNYALLLGEVVARAKLCSPYEWSDAFRLETIPWLFSRSENVSIFVKILLANTNAGNAPALHVGVHTLIAWFEHIREGWSSRTIYSGADLGFLCRHRLSSTFDFDFLRLVLQRIFDRENGVCSFQVVFKMLSFLYNMWDLLPEREANVIRVWILKEHFFSLFLHWAAVGREYFINLLLFRVLRKREWSARRPARSRRKSQTSPSLRRLRLRTLSSPTPDDEDVSLNFVLKGLLESVGQRPRSATTKYPPQLVVVDRDRALKWLNEQPYCEVGNSVSVFGALVRAGMLMRLSSSDLYGSLGPSFSLVGTKSLNRTSLELEAAVEMSVTDSNAMDQSAAVVPSARRMVCAAIRHVRRLVRKRSDQKVAVHTLRAQRLAIEEASSECRSEGATEAEAARWADKMREVSRSLKNSIDNEMRDDEREKTIAACLNMLEDADKASIDVMRGKSCGGTGSGSIKYARSALALLERQILFLESLRTSSAQSEGKSSGLSLPFVDWSIQVHDIDGKVVALEGS
eukprot:g2662.t1